MDQRIDGKRVMAAIEAVGLTKTFGAGKKAVRALDGLDLEVSEGRVLGLLGPNGAGKTTTVRMLTTLLTPDSGQLRVLGRDVCAEPDEVRRLRRVLGREGQPLTPAPLPPGEGYALGPASSRATPARRADPPPQGGGWFAHPLALSQLSTNPTSASCTPSSATVSIASPRKAWTRRLSASAREIPRAMM